MPARPARHRALRTLAVAAVAALTIGGLSLVSATSAQAATRVSFPRAVPSWANSANASGTPKSTDLMQAELNLSLQDQAGALALATAVSDPSSPSYRHYLTPAQWIATYAPTQPVFDSAVAQLRQEGLQITGLPASREYIVFRGTAAQLDTVFATRLRTYSVQGQDVVAPSTTPSLSTAQAKNVAGITLDQGRLLTKPATATQSSVIKKATTGLSTLASLLSTGKSSPSAVTVATPCSSYLGVRTVTVPNTYGTTRIGTANCGYSPRQLRTIYKTSASSGAGQTVAIIDAYASPTIKYDVNTYSRFLGEPQFTTNQFTDLSPNKATFTDQKACGTAAGWQGEQTLDVEAVHAVAPAANVLYVGATDCGFSTDIALSTVLDQGLANIVSNSYGESGEPTDAGSAANVVGEVNLELQAAGEGIGLYFASGDNGDERANTGAYQADFPASSPWVTAVGGTAVLVNKASSPVVTVGWGDTLDPIVKGVHHTLRYSRALPGPLFGGGAGGGRSHLTGFTEPAYQQGVVPASLSGGRRSVPDVSALADPFTGFLIGYRPITNESTLATGSYGYGVAGGTSLATPITAALMAVAQQRSGAVVGFANPTLYAMAKSNSGALTDVTPRAGNKKTALAYSDGKNSYAVTLDTDSSLKTAKGYDFVTGLGQINLSHFTLPQAAPTN